jgi:hypothetical protein
MMPLLRIQSRVLTGAKGSLQRGLAKVLADPVSGFLVGFRKLVVGMCGLLPTSPDHGAQVLLLSKNLAFPPQRNIEGVLALKVMNEISEKLGVLGGHG